MNLFRPLVMLTVVASLSLIACQLPFGTTADNGPKKVSVTGVNLNKSTLTLVVGGSQSLTATVAPQGATDATVTWKSSSPSVVSVSSAGLVTALTVGAPTTITVTTGDGSLTATCVVTVVGQGSSNVTFDWGSFQTLAFTQTDLTLASGNSLTLAPTFTSGGTSWSWVVNGVVDTDATTASYTFSASQIGFYAISVNVLKDGVYYSGSVNLRVVPNQE